MAAGKRLQENVTPNEFAITVLALLSYYRILNSNNPYVPSEDCEEIFWVDEDPGSIDKGREGRLIERMAYIVDTIGRNLKLAVMDIPYTPPSQPYHQWEQNMSTERLYAYCLVRMARACSHCEGMSIVGGIFGF